MDSCHLFNFLFGTKKATTELSKCFSSSIGRRDIPSSSTSSSTFAAKTSKSTNTGKGTKRDASDNHETHNNQPPSSPLKQLQMKIVSLAGGGRGSTKTRHGHSRPGHQCRSDCGTYRATLVQSLDADCDGDDENNNNNTNNNNNSNGEEELMQIDIVDNLAENSVINSGGSDEILAQNDCNKETRKIEQPGMRQDSNCRRVIMYDEHQGVQNSEDQVVASTAEVYNIVLQDGDSRRAILKCIELNHGDQQMQQSEDKCRDKSSTIKQVALVSTKNKRNVHVRNLVRSIESNKSFEGSLNEEEEELLVCNESNITDNDRISMKLHGYSKPVTLVKPLPPKTPPKTNKAKCLNLQLTLNKPVKVNQLFQDEKFLIRLFDKLEPLDRCAAAQVCRSWRNILYANQNYWKDLINVIDCTQLRREHLIECILNTLQTAKTKQQLKGAHPEQNVRFGNNKVAKHIGSSDCVAYGVATRRFDYDSVCSKVMDDRKRCSHDSGCFDVDQDDIWRIQELCNKFTQKSGLAHSRQQQQPQPSDNANGSIQTSNVSHQEQSIYQASKSSSIPSQISSTLSSISISSLLSPLSESSRVESMKEKLYSSLDGRGFDAICLFGATDDDIEELISKFPAHKRILCGRLNNCFVSNRGLELFVSTFNQIEELELSGCNELTNSFELKTLSNLKRLIITDCINIADGVAQKLVDIVHQLDQLTIQAYHLTDAFIDYISLNADTSKLKRLEVPNCKEITNQSLLTIAKHFPQLEAFSISGSTKISDAGLDILAERATRLRILDLSWCSRISNVSLEHIACDLGDTLTDLILDRNVQINDIGLGNLATMRGLQLLHIRWCPHISDVGLESIIDIKSLRYLSLAGLHQITARSLLCLIETDLLEVELTNCPAVNNDLLLFLAAKMPKCDIIF